MRSSQATEWAISNLANTMRLCVEANLRFKELFVVDREEAVNNLDRAFEAKLESFHTLYDASKALFPYFDYGDTALIIAVRNAIHHRNHPLFRSLYSRIFLVKDLSRWRGASFLLAAHPTTSGAPIRMSHHVLLNDVEVRLDPKLESSYLDTSLKSIKAQQRFATVAEQLSFQSIRDKASRERFPPDQVYLDLMPIFTSAVCRVFRAMKAAGIGFEGYDAGVYMEPFTSEIKIDISNPTFSVSRIPG